MQSYKVYKYRGDGLSSNCYTIKADNYDQACTKARLFEAPPGWIVTVERIN